MCPKILNIRKRLKIAYFFYFWTNLGPILVKLIVEHIIRPQNSTARLFKFRTDIVIKGQTMTFYYQEIKGHLQT